jgi:hypothetical protein
MVSPLGAFSSIARTRWPLCRNCTCASYAQKEAIACPGNGIRVQLLDDKVTAALKDQLFSRGRLISILSSLTERRAARAAAVNGRLVSLQSEVTTAEQNWNGSIGQLPTASSNSMICCASRSQSRRPRAGRLRLRWTRQWPKALAP